MDVMNIGLVKEASKDKNIQEKTCKMFESYFLFLLLKEMEKIASFGNKKKDFSKDTYMSIVYEKLADYLSEKGVGIKEMLMNSLKFYEKRSDNMTKER